MPKDIPDLRDLARPGARITVRAIPNAARNKILRDGDDIRVYVTAVPEDGKANRAVVKLLAKALGIAKSDLNLIQGQTSRDKTFEIRG